MSNRLFTAQSLAHRSDSGFGRLRLIAPPGSFLISGILVLIIAFAAYLLISQSYQRKTTVHGYLHASVMRVSPELTGTLTQILVKEGQTITAGSPVAVIQSEVLRQSEQASTFNLLIDATEQQLGNLKRVQRGEQSQIVAKQKGLAESRQRLQSIQQIQRFRLKGLGDIYDAASSLKKQGNLSTLEWAQYQDQYLVAKQQLEEITERLARNREEQSLAVLQQQDLKARHAMEEAELKEKRIHLIQSRDNWLANSQQIVKAPMDGQVAAIFKRTGDVVALKESIMTLIPSNEKLHARLLIPSRAIGFIQPGQVVNVLYDAFPHLQFGAYSGKVLSVTDHPIVSQDLPLQIPAQGTYFLAIVTLSRQSVTAYGKNAPLKPGMTLKADVILNKRTLLDWLFEPLLAAKGHYV